MYNKVNHIHFIGIGGIGMSGIAQLLKREGYLVSGSDKSQSDTVRSLQQQGISVSIGHKATNISGAQLVVVSSAISETNPEVLFARENQIPVIPRAEMLAELMRLKYGIAVAGAHGKTTTTSMVATALMAGDLDPTIVVGGRMDNFGGTNARLGNGKFIVVEADESDGSFNKLAPSIAVVTNIDREHMDHYGSMGELRKAYLDFINKVPFYGLSVICGDDPHLQLLKSKITRRCLTYGFSKHNQYGITEYRSLPGGSEYEVNTPTGPETVRLCVAGKHNALNAVAALAIADELLVPRKKSLAGIQAYQGVQRRFQLRGKQKEILFVDDYAHHPAEIRATLEAAREQYPTSRIHVVFQPHRFSRVQDLFDEFISCFDNCDGVAILPIYAASEEAIEGVSGELLTQTIQRRFPKPVEFFERPLQAVEYWMEKGQPGDVVLTLGAGDIPNVYRELF